MLTGIKLQAHPTEHQKLILSQWMGCARFIWNAKCDEARYLQGFAKRYLPTKTYPIIDQTFSQYKDQTLSPWLFNCPSQILRNSTVNYYQTHRHFLKGLCGKPKRKKKTDTASIHLTNELFRFETGEDGVRRLLIGSKTNNIGFLSLKNHSSYGEPKLLRIKKRNGRYFVSFCYEDNLEDLQDQNTHLEYLKGLAKEELEKIVIGVDRGVKRPVQAGPHVYDFSPEQKRKKLAKERYIKRCQRKLAKQQKTSKRREKQKRKLARAYEKVAHIRQDFCHQTSRLLVNQTSTQVIVFEDLKTKQMTKKPKAKKIAGQWAPNRRKSKAGLNRSILDKGWHILETFVQYKATKAGKAFFKIPAYYTSQECADCGHIHPNNRQTQARFCCQSCGHTDQADHNAAKVIKKRAINLLLNSGTELSSRGVLLDSGRGAAGQTRGARQIVQAAENQEASKKKELTALTHVA